MWPVTQPVLLSLRRCTGNVVSRYPKEWPGQRPSPGEFQETDWAGTDLIPSNASVDFHSRAHSEHQGLLSVLGNVV